MRKYTRAEAGKIGGEKSKLISSLKKQNRIIEYDKNPNKCKQCNAIINYENRKNKFCNHSCSATYTNLTKSKLVKWNCLGCGKEHLTQPYKIKKYCGHSCQHIITKENTYNKILQGDVADRGTIRKSFIQKFGHKCFECNLSEWRGYPIPLEVDHIDGNAGNNSFENLRLLCPNCHGLTETWKGRNKGSGRAARGLSLS